MSTYYGGRSEVHIRRQIVRVLYCDFVSMYPTVCTLMGLWRYVIAEGIEQYDATVEVKKLLEKITLEDLQRPETWRLLTAIVQIEPDGDILPVRSKYDGLQYTIGVNYLKAQKLWYTLADCIASKLVTGRSPRVIKATGFRPRGIQRDLTPIAISGNANYTVDPLKDDFYRSLIDLRTDVKSKLKAALPEEKTRYEVEQLALKICANATSYGIFVELNVVEQAEPAQVDCYGGSGNPFVAEVRNIEQPGRYFHPLLATLITGAARLMLAISETLTEKAGLTWAFCDTDSMAIAKPNEMSEAEFLSRALIVSNWFTSLNPYKAKGPLFKIEDANYELADGEALSELYCFAVSAKRYVLFNIDKAGRPVLRKASAHGLGHLLPPDDRSIPRNIPKPIVKLEELGVELWQYYVWYRIVEAAIEGHPDQIEIEDLPGFNLPAVSQYGAMTPGLLNWFKRFNDEKPYRDQVKPFNFMLAFQAIPFNL